MKFTLFFIIILPTIGHLTGATAASQSHNTKTRSLAKANKMSKSQKSKKKTKKGKSSISWEYEDSSPNHTTNKTVDWSTNTYRLQASCFMFFEMGKDWTRHDDASAEDLIVEGESGDFLYHSIEITWNGTDGIENRFNAHFEAHPIAETWEMLQARVYDKSEEWMTFNGDFGIKGELGTCFKMDEITMTNDEGDKIVFENIRLATFVDTAWFDSAAAYDDCFE